VGSVSPNLGGEARSQGRWNSDERRVLCTLNLSRVQTMLRFTRPLLQASKLSTGLYGLAVHPNPLPELTKTYESTLAALSSIPKHAAYRQGTEALTLRKLKIVQDANGDVAAVEKQLDEGQIEQAIAIAKDELSMVGKMAEWKAYVSAPFVCMHWTNYG
jgi:NADH dehydrogenase (ubiquinone) 1 alpha subcomplex subunit 5